MDLFLNCCTQNIDEKHVWPSDLLRKPTSIPANIRLVKQRWYDISIQYCFSEHDLTSKIQCFNTCFELKKYVTLLKMWTVEYVLKNQKKRYTNYSTGDRQVLKADFTSVCCV